MRGAVYISAIFRLTLMLMLAGLLLACKRDWIEIEEEIPVAGYGEPKWNPLYALRESLRLDGVQAHSRRLLNLKEMNLQPADTLVLLGDVRELSADIERELLEWVHRGGHLVIQAPQWQPLYTSSFILQRLTVEPSQARSRCHHHQNQPLLCSGNRFTVHNPAQAEVYWSDKHDKTAVWARLKYSAGYVDIAGSLDFLHNGFLANYFPWQNSGLRPQAHRALARQMLAPNYGRGTIYLIFNRDIPSLWKLLWQHGWPVWLPLALALAGGLWRGSQRFGAVLPAPPAQRRSLLEHVRASGYYLYRRRQSAVLYQAVRNVFMQRLQQRAPWIAAQTGAEQIQAIARHLRYSPQQVRDSLTLPAVGDNAILHARIALLIEMRNKL